MRKILLGTSALIALCGQALAADLPAKAPVVVIPAFNWTGIYIGGFVGGAVAAKNANSTEPFTSVPLPAGLYYYAPGLDNNYSLPSTFTGGLTMGVNFQPRGSNWLIGFEGEAGYLHLARTFADVNSAAFGFDSSDRTQIGDWYGAFTGRLGFTVDRLLIYGKGGAAFVSKSAGFDDNCAVAPCSNRLFGIGTKGTQMTWAAGGGAEYAFTDNWSIKGEYLYLATSESYSYFGQPTIAGVGTGSSYSSTHTDPGTHTAKIGINYRWGP
jgi:outer membrane immunogenic protein